jgi:hypothetical protein
MPTYNFRIDPIRAQSALDPDLAGMLKGAPSWSEDDWKDVLPPITGWRLMLMHCGQVAEHQDFPDGDDGFRSAQAAGKAWLASHGVDGISQWLASSSGAMRRMNSDPDFRHQISKRGF